MFYDPWWGMRQSMPLKFWGMPCYIEVAKFTVPACRETGLLRIHETINNFLGSLYKNE